MCFSCPLNLQAISIALSKERNKFYKTHGRDMTIPEMLEFLHNDCCNYNYEVNMDLLNTVLKIDVYHLNSCKYSIDDKIDNYDTLNFSYYDNKNDVYIKDVLKDEYDLEADVVLRSEANEIVLYIENNFESIDIEIFKETLGLIDGVPKVLKKIGRNYNISSSAVWQRYKKVLVKTRQKFENWK